jgi:hypothetical protein
MGEDILYHYCSNETLLNILKYNSVHLSSLDAANDFREGSWLIDRLESRLRGRGISDPKKIDEIIDDFRLRREATVGLAFCLSKEQDDLSQWRGYAEDGCGISIGFDRTRLQQILDAGDASIQPSGQKQKETPLKFFLQDVIYSEPSADNWLDDWLNRWAGAISTEAIAQEFGDALFKYKNPAFIKEHEVRIFIRAHMSEHASFIQWKSRSGFLVPYIDVGYVEPNDFPIKEIWLGPKNKTNTTHLKSYLKNTEWGGHVEVHQSSASYR